MPSALSEAEGLKYWLALLRAKGIGPATFHKILMQFARPADVFAANVAQLSSLGLSKLALDSIKNPDWERVEYDFEWYEQSSENNILTFADADYPALLREISVPPPVLYVRGDVSLLADPQIAIVGSRNPTPAGLDNAYAFSGDMARAGLSVISGLAYGIDAAGHQGALDAGGTTIAVAGTGLDRVYPASHHQLAKDIVKNGALISEFPIGSVPRRENFPRRNRIISGMSVGVLVVEAALKSGSLITARAALEQGREVLAIPGSIHNPLSKGCHALIRDGAKLVESVADIFSEIGSLVHHSLAQVSDGGDVELTNLDCEQKKVLNNIGFEPVSIDDLVERTGLAADLLTSILLVLELEKYVAPMPGGAFMRLKKEC